MSVIPSHPVKLIDHASNRQPHVQRTLVLRLGRGPRAVTLQSRSAIRSHQSFDSESGATEVRVSDNRRRKRVLFVAEAFGGGVFEVTRTQAAGLVSLGYEVGIAYGRRAETPGNVRELVDDAVELFPLPWSDRSIRSQLGAHRALRRAVHDWNPDVLHLVSSYAGFHGVFAASGARTVYTPQAYSFTMRSESALKRWLYLIIETFVASNVDLVGACSLSEGEQARSLPASAEVAVVPNGIAELNASHLASSTPVGDKELSVIAMGRPLPQRQPEACARILSVVGRGHRVTWLGGGSDESAGTRALLDAGIAMTGWMPHEETLTALGESAIYLHWTAWDGLPLSVLEAMALDTIVVASDIGPNREILGPAQVCRTEEEAVALISSLLEDTAMRERFLASQRQRRASYGADVMVRRWAGIYDSMLPGGNDFLEAA
jgi:glycosyltransferase involved in cell wall biosynthesis